MLNSVNWAKVDSSAAGATIQPRRQPVIDHALEKLFTDRILSSASAKCWKEGAISAPLHNLAYTSSVIIQILCLRQCASTA